MKVLPGLMKIFSCLEKQIAFSLVMFLAMPSSSAETKPVRQTPRTAGDVFTTQSQPQAPDPVTSVAVAESGLLTSYPDSAGTMWAQTSNQNQPASSPQTNQNKPDNSGSTPGGTAAAPYVKQEGVTASRPAGAAIAPAKQRRIRSFAIRAGLVVGACVAIGVVTAASLGSPNRPH